MKLIRITRIDSQVFGGIYLPQLLEEVAKWLDSEAMTLKFRDGTTRQFKYEYLYNDMLIGLDEEDGQHLITVYYANPERVAERLKGEIL